MATAVDDQASVIGHQSAAGARPFVPPIPGLEEVGYLTSDTVWNLRTLPKRLIVLGGGPIGSELTQTFARLGSQVTQVEMGPGVVTFSGPRAALYRANLHLRCASRVLWLLGDAPCRSADELYAMAYALPWEDFLLPEGTLAVSSHGTGPGLENSMFAALRVKDAVVDRFRARFGRRPRLGDGDQ